ncbi:hypothetical protein SUGI_0563430 [Cryptomeria japonica]|uniref:peroxidase A2 n=1 Tax=Cryptomeria japonica TaxID=3369 RepID=UPI002408AE1C|nr:peroxidase A2 [Cryptomeria japonica]GLJ28598.1 hypothetical protein SUGI_0563430 [Cryptomeria japonica]
MATTPSFFSVLMILLGLWENVSAQSGGKSLTPENYWWTCPEAEAIVFDGVARAVAQDPRMAASLLRMHFHDCFVQGCDASILLDGNATFGEKTAGPNNNSLRGFEVIDSIKTELEFACPGIVSCADILAIAARDSVVLTGGPAWLVQLGRKDSRTPNRKEANEKLPPPNSDVGKLIRMFHDVGLTEEDMVTLSGAHTIGKARCSSFRDRLQSQPDPTLGNRLLTSLKQLCGFNNTNPLTNLDLKTPITFDNGYYRNLPSGEGLLRSDQVLYSTDERTKNLVEYYIHNPEAFFHNFKVSMIKMGNIRPLLGKDGEVRRHCRFPN